MRALLVNPWVHDFKAFDFWNKPVGLLTVARVLKQLGFKIDFIDCMDRLSPFYTTETKTDSWGRGKYHHEIVVKPDIFRNVTRKYKRYGMPRRVFIDTIGRFKNPDVIFVTSAMTYWYPGVFEAIKLLKKQFPSTKIILGGIYATLCEKHALQYSGADTIFPGAVEEHMTEFITTAGVHNTQRYMVNTIVPDYTVYEKLHYVVVITSRGCPFNCTYCATKTLCGTFRSISNRLILSQLDILHDRTKNIAFFDDALLYNKGFPDLLKTIIQRKYDFNLHASNGLHCRYITREIADLMFGANFKTMYLSLETTNPSVQQKTGGKVNTQEFIQAVSALKSAGFAPHQLHAYILYGMPGQGYGEIFDSIKLCKDLGVKPHLCEFSPIPHTEEYSRTGFDENTDPLFHNNLFFTWFHPKPKSVLYKKIKHSLSM